MRLVRVALPILLAFPIASCATNPTSLPSAAPSTPSAARLTAAASAKEISYKDSDGWLIRGDYYAVPGAKKAVLLLHQRGGSASDWKPLSEDLQTAGIGVLAIDQRGAGRSIGKLNNNDAPWDTTPDITGGIAWLQKHGFSPKHVALAGASYGANNAAIYAASHTDVPAIALISPGVNYHGLAIPPTLGKYPGAILVVTDKEDQIADGGPQAIQQIAPKATVQAYDGNAHGTAIFDDHLESVSALTSFLKDKA